MGWINQVPYRHSSISCRKPTFNKNFGVGSTWRCDECNRQWKCTGIVAGDQRDGTYATWEIYNPSSYSMYDR